MKLYRDYHLHPRVLFKLLLCKLCLVNEFCHRCGIRVDQVWHAPDWLWSDVEQVGEAGVRCIACFDRDCCERGILINWMPLADERTKARIFGRPARVTDLSRGAAE